MTKTRVRSMPTCARTSGSTRTSGCGAPTARGLPLTISARSTRIQPDAAKRARTCTANTAPAPPRASTAAHTTYRAGHLQSDSFARQSGTPVRYVFEGRQGKSFALNSALPISRGEILAFTDDDITPRHDWLQTTLGAIRSRALDGVGGKVLPRWEVEPPGWLRQRPHLLVWLAMLDNDERRLLEYPITNQCRLVGTNMAFHRALFGELGDFNTSLGHHGKPLYGTEETELIYRFLKGGKRIGYEPDIVVYHHIGRARLTKRFFLKRVFYQAVADTVMSDAGAPFVWRAERWRYRHLAGSFVSVLARTVARRGDAFECQLEFSEDFGTLWARTMRLRPPQVMVR